MLLEVDPQLFYRQSVDLILGGRLSSHDEDSKFSFKKTKQQLCTCIKLLEEHVFDISIHYTSETSCSNVLWRTGTHEEEFFSLFYELSEYRPC